MESGGKIEFRRQVDWPVIHVVKIDNLYPAIHWQNRNCLYRRIKPEFDIYTKK